MTALTKNRSRLGWQNPRSSPRVRAGGYMAAQLTPKPKGRKTSDDKTDRRANWRLNTDEFLDAKRTQTWTTPSQEIPTMECVSLRQRFGKQYKIAWDPAYDPNGVPRAKLDPWYMIIECEYGEIFPHGGDILTVEFDGHCKTRNRVGRLPITRLHQEGDDFGSFHFHVKDFDKIAKLVNPRRRPRLTKKRRDELRRRMRQQNQQKPRKRPKSDPETPGEEKPDD